MKKFVKISLFVFGFFLITLFSLCTIISISLSKYQIDENKLVDVQHSTIYLDVNDEELFSLNANTKITKYSEINKNLINALISIEDKRFYTHKGVDYKSLLRACINNIKTFSFKEGGSTITQQLVKNTHLTQDKTLKRKIIEMSLARKLEKKFSKEEILEKYLNTVYFGDNCYGITSACEHYFNKIPNELSLAECSFLAGIIKAPSYYTLEENYNKSIERQKVVLNEMLLQKHIDSNEYTNALNEKIKLNRKDKSIFSLENLLKKELENNNSIFPYKDNIIKTTISKKQQTILEDIINKNNVNYDTTAIIIDKNFNVLAYASTCFTPKRQLGSTIKPLLVYGPALENNVITPSTLILDEKTNFNGYQPSNYNDKYNGYISAKDCISKSLNIPSIKILNMNGVENSAKFLKKMNFTIQEEDLTLPLALGAKKDGETLLTIANAYTTLINNGLFKKYSIIREPYKFDKATSYEKIFSEDTNFLINDALNDCAKSGTAKKLGTINDNICAKTGTVGNKNGNTDAYCISYNTEYCIAVWCGVKDSINPDNNLTGGGITTNISCNIWEHLYKDKTFPNFFKKPDSIKEILLDKESYNENHTLEIADSISPLRYTIIGKFRESNTPNIISNRFSSPNIKKPILSVNNNEISIQLCLTQYYDILIKKYKNNTLIKEYDSKKMTNKNLFKDIILDNETYYYSVTPYYCDSNKYYYGKEIILDKIKLPTTSVGNDWWKDDL